MKVLFFILAFSTFTMGHFYYFRFIMRSNEKNPIPWIIWALLGLDVMINVILSPNTSTIEKVVNVSFFIGPLSIALALIVKQGIGKIGKEESYYISITLALLVTLIILRYKVGIENLDNILTIGFILLEIIVIFPILREIYQQPTQEDIKPWFYWLLSSFFGIITIGESPSFTGVGVVIYILVICSIITMYLFYHKNMKKVA